MGNKIERPYYTPDCCGQPAKWVVQSQNLAYFYCEVCKKEVEGVSGVGGNDRWNFLSEAVRAGKRHGVLVDSFKEGVYGGDARACPVLPQGQSLLDDDLFSLDLDLDEE